MVRGAAAYRISGLVAILSVGLLVGCTAPVTPPESAASGSTAAGATTAEQAPSAQVTRTTNANAPKVVDYGAGILVVASGDTAKLTGAPDDFKSFLVDELTAFAKDSGLPPECDAKAQLTILKVRADGYASGRGVVTSPQGTMACTGPGLHLLWATDAAGTWSIVDQTQDASFLCSKLDEYAVPATISGPQCFDGTSLRPYKRA